MDMLEQGVRAADPNPCNLCELLQTWVEVRMEDVTPCGIYTKHLFLPWDKEIMCKIEKETGGGVAFKPKKTFGRMIPNAKVRNIGEKKQGIYNIDSNCGKNYIEVTERSLDTRLNEHQYAVTTKV